ncbi:MAG: signal peptide peptidase SppA [Pseudomonadota bacterium]
MSLDVETVIERRRLRRQVGWWRALAILVAVALLAVFTYSRANDLGLSTGEQIARVTIEGVITDDRERLKLLKKLAKNDSVRGVIVFVNSPGGTTTGGEGLYQELRDLSAKKPVVAQFGTVAASAAYIAGLGTDHIVARGNTITGSVGVLVQWPEISGLLEKLGVKMNEIKSGSLKAEPSLYNPISPDARAVTESMIEESKRWFVGLVEDRRKIDPSSVPGLLEGRVYSGRDAMRHKLVDRLGGEAAAVEWLVKTRGLPAGLRIVDWEPGQATPWSVQAAVESFAKGLGAAFMDGLRSSFGATGPLSTLGLDGLLSVWQPSKM